MEKARYEYVKERIRATETKSRRYEENRVLWEEVEADCSPQQKSALYRVAGQLNADAEDFDLSQF